MHWTPLIVCACAGDDAEGGIPVRPENGRRPQDAQKPAEGQGQQVQERAQLHQGERWRTAPKSHAVRCAPAASLTAAARVRSTASAFAVTLESHARIEQAATGVLYSPAGQWQSCFCGESREPGIARAQLGWSPGAEASDV